MIEIIDILRYNFHIIIMRFQSNVERKRKRLLLVLMAEDDVKNGRVAPISDTFQDLRAMLREGSGT